MKCSPAWAAREKCGHTNMRESSRILFAARRELQRHAAWRNHCALKRDELEARFARYNVRWESRLFGRRNCDARFARRRADGQCQENGRLHFLEDSRLVQEVQDRR